MLEDSNREDHRDQAVPRVRHRLHQDRHSYDNTGHASQWLYDREYKQRSRRCWQSQTDAGMKISVVEQLSLILIHKKNKKLNNKRQSHN